MPKFGAHMMFAELALQRRPDLFNDCHENALRLGAIGPDTTLFLFDPLGKLPNVRQGFATALSVLTTMQNIKEEIQTIADELTKPVDDIQDWLTGGLSKDLKYTINAAVEAIFLAAKLGIAFGVGTINVKNPVFSDISKLPQDFITNPQLALEKWVIGGADNFGFPFRMFGHPYTSDGAWKKPAPIGDYSEWWWMDMLHYRRSGSYARSLLDLAKSPVQASYARGYLTHVGGDICGHPYINALVGGPFRNHAYRHIVLETLVDVRLWHSQRAEDVLDARFDKLIDLSDDELAQVSDLVVRAMRQTYTPPMVPSLLAGGHPTKGEWAFAYRTMQQYLRLSTGGSVPRPTPPPSTPREVIDELKELLGRNQPGPFPRWRGDLLEMLRALFAWFGKGLSILVMLATLPAAVLIRFMTIAPRWILYLINMALFYVISAIRTMLCLTGWGYCSREDLVNFGFLNDMIRTGGQEGGSYPRETVPVPKPPFYWLMNPAAAIPQPAAVEQPPTWAIAPSAGGLAPEWLIDPANVMDFAAVTALIDAQTPLETIQIEQRYLKASVFGNPIDFSIAMLDKKIRIPDFDLDGDRGFGFKGWEDLPNSRYV